MGKGILKILQDALRRHITQRYGATRLDYLFVHMDAISSLYRGWIVVILICRACELSFAQYGVLFSYYGAMM